MVLSAQSDLYKQTLSTKIESNKLSMGYFVCCTYLPNFVIVALTVVFAQNELVHGAKARVPK